MTDSTARLRVLVVEDQPLNLKLAREVLRLGGYDVTGATNGEEGVALATAEQFHVIVMDVQLPGMDGLAATRRIRASGGPSQSVPVLAVSALARPEDMAIARAAGATGFVAKPYRMQALLDAVASAVGHPKGSSSSG
jgi:CheY-like chemotaxis protein